MPYYCLECGGSLFYDSELKCYVCKSCGLTFTIQQLIDEGKKESGENSFEEKRRRQKEYLKWWSSKKT